jgi:hypothetical protein
VDAMLLRRGSVGTLRAVAQEMWTWKENASRRKRGGLACRNAQTRAEKASCVDCCSWLRERRAYSTARVICDASPVVKEKK